MTRKSESQLLDIVNDAIKGGFAPLLLINGEYYDINFASDKNKCRWLLNGKCGLDECKVCNGTTNHCNKI